MRISVLVGNGFDLKIGLKTSPSDFLSEFIRRNPATDKAGSDGSASAALASQIKKDGVDEWASFEQRLGEYSSSFSLSEKECYIQQAAALVSFLDQWIEAEQATIDDEFISMNAKQCIGSLVSFENNLPPGQKKLIESTTSVHSREDISIDILCFNYTNCLEKMYLKVGGKGAVLKRFSNGHVVKLGDLIHVHESVKGQIVCGVDSLEQISNEDLRKDPRVVDTLVKKRIQERVLFSNSHTMGFRSIDASSMFLIFGMSYGVTDHRWWLRIINRLRNIDRSALVLFAYRPDKKKPSVFDLDSRNREEKNRLYSGAGLSGPDERIDDKIVVVDSSALFPVNASLASGSKLVGRNHV